MRYCKTCLQPDTRPGEVFTKEGVCLACKNFLIQSSINYEDRFLLLLEILKRFPKSKNTIFDCILGVSGGKDSTRQALWLRDKLRLNPLLVCMSWPPEQVNNRGAHNISNLINLGFNMIISSPAPKTFKNLMRAAFLRYGNWAKSTELALYSSVPQVAISHKIPLIFNGEDPGQKESQALGDFGWDNNNLRNLNTLCGAKLDWLLKTEKNPAKLIPYIYPDLREFKKKRIQIVDLGWFLGDWSFNTNGAYAVSYGMEPRSESPEDTGDPSYVSSVDEDWVSVNQLIKYYKYGFGKATDYFNEEIRFGRITREDAISMVKRYDGRCNEGLISSFCDYIEIPLSNFWSKVKKVTNKKLFHIGENNNIQPLFEIGTDL